MRDGRAARGPGGRGGPGRRAAAGSGRHRRRRRAPGRGARAGDQRGAADGRERSRREEHRRRFPPTRRWPSGTTPSSWARSVATGTGRAEVLATGMAHRAGTHRAPAGDRRKRPRRPLQGRLRRLGRTPAVPLRWRSSALVAVLGVVRGTAAARRLHVGGLAGGRRGSRGAAGHRHHRARDRRPAHGGAERAGPQAPGGRDARLRDGDLHRQDRHAHHRE